jgi:hypothetical protein
MDVHTIVVLQRLLALVAVAIIALTIWDTRRRGQRLEFRHFGYLVGGGVVILGFETQNDISFRAGVPIVAAGFAVQLWGAIQLRRARRASQATKAPPR